MRTLILATVSAVALGIAGAAPSFAAQNTATTPGSAITQPAETTSPAPSPAATTGATQSSMPQAGTATPPLGSNSQYNKPYMANTSPSATSAGQVTRSEVRQAQQKLRGDGLYRGRIDGLMGAETSQALRRYQQKNGLQTTARLDQDTLNSLLGTGAGQGSSMPASSPPSSAAGTSASGATTGTTPTPANGAK